MLSNCGAGEDSWESLVDCKEIKQLVLKEINSEYGKDWCWNWSSNTDTELIRKDPDAGKDWKQKEKGVAEDEMVR